jgi:hypothetical protein
VKIDLATIIGILTAISLLLGILAIIYKFFKLLVFNIRASHAKERAQDARISDLLELVKVQTEEIKQMQNFLSLDPKERDNRRFYPTSALSNLSQKTLEHYNSNTTDFT